ncbi:protein delay of germination 1 [Quercus suber]|uniref:Protein delay of germination 1 n=1 Tax=Quercus suber TaxID=58331 RepID=A0AAW0M1B7_QUESU
MIAKGLFHVGEINREVDKVLDQHEKAMVGVLEEADRLRLSILKELIEILTPVIELKRSRTDSLEKKTEANQAMSRIN